MRDFTFSEDWVSDRFPAWRHLLEPLRNRPGVRVIEVGSFEGRSAVWFLTQLPTAHIFCIDPWARAFVERRFDSNITAGGFADRVTKLRGPSWEQWPALFGSITPADVVYVDGSHEARDVFYDGLCGLRVLRPGALMIFDDYGWEPNLDRARAIHHHPRAGIDAFLSLNDWEVAVEFRGYQIVVRKNLSAGDNRN